MSHDPGDDHPEESVMPGEWIDALCLAVLRVRADWHGEAFHFAREKFAARAKATPLVGLIPRERSSCSCAACQSTSH
ncbi:hypothetical protein [Streptomyces sp. HF10]|uniref:hypothetical protein n=1 Tax=Streptomyces sp. HF10 TaxID=2692233 RepID=UPI001F3B4431|nr:hypothetical protein [Streptomyces sp. HF10]